MYLPYYCNNLLTDPSQLTTILSFCGCTAAASLNFVFLALGTHYPIHIHEPYDFWFHLCTYIKKTNMDVVTVLHTLHTYITIICTTVIARIYCHAVQIIHMLNRSHMSHRWRGCYYYYYTCVHICNGTCVTHMCILYTCMQLATLLHTVISVYLNLFTFQ